MCGLPKRVCVLVYGLLCDVVWYVVCAVFFTCGAYVVVWFVCDRVCDVVWLIVVFVRVWDLKDRWLGVLCAV